MSNIKTIYDSISSAVSEYNSSVAYNAGISSSKERVKNLFFTYRKEILEALSSRGEMEKEINKYKRESETYYNALCSADDENDELKHRIKELEAQIEQRDDKPTKKPKAKQKTLTAVVE